MSDAGDAQTLPDDESATGPERSTIHGNPLSRGERAACAVIGLTGGAAGAAGVFVHGTNAGGVPVLLGLGAFFGYMAVSGQRLSHIKVGNNEASFIGRILKDPKISDEAKLEVAEHLEENLDLPPAAQRVVSEVLDSRALAAQYEQEVVAAVERVAGPAIAVRRAPGRPAYDWDLLLRSGRGTAVAVEIKWRIPAGHPWIQVRGHWSCRRHTLVGRLVERAGRRCQSEGSPRPGVRASRVTPLLASGQ